MIEREVVDAAKTHGDGAVVLLHSWPTATRAAIAGIVGRLRDAGASFVAIDALGEVPSDVT